MVAIKNTLALTVLASVVSAQNPIVASLINDIVEGIAAAKTDNDVSDEAATSEIQSVVGVIQQNTDVQNLVSQVIPIAAMGLNDENFPQVLSAAHATLEAFQGSPEYPEAVKGLKDVLPHYDVQQALGNVQNNLGNVLALVTPSLPSLTPNHSEQWEAATKNVQALAASLGFLPGAADNKEAATSAEPSKTEAASASATEASSKAESKSEEASKTEESKSEEASKTEESKSEEASKTDASSAAATESKAESSKAESKAESKTDASASASATGSAAESKAESSKAESAKPTSASVSATGAASASASASASTTVEQGNGAASYNLALGGVVGAAAMVVALL